MENYGNLESRKSQARLQATLSHQAPDRVVVDFGATGQTGMHVRIIEGLRRYFGLEKRPVKVEEPYQMLGLIDEDLAEAMAIDTIGISPRTTMFGFANEDWKPFRTFWGQEVLVSRHFVTTTDRNGDLLIFPEGDDTVPPSGRMPSSGYFFDAIIRQNGMDESRLDPRDNLEEFRPVSEEDLTYVEQAVTEAGQTGRGVVANFGGTAFGDIALVPAPFLKHPKGIRDVTEWYMSTVTRQDYIHRIFDYQADMAVQNLEKVFARIGNQIDVVFICGTDFGTQTSSFCSVETFNALYAPYYKRVNDWIHRHTSWKTFKHCCGAIEPFIDHFIESGFDIINPVQYSAAGMDSAKLKEKYGGRITFWGGGVDTQHILPFGTPQQVKDEVRKQCDILAPNGGFVFSSVHNVQANVPIENVIAMLETLKEYRGI